MKRKFQNPETQKPWLKKSKTKMTNVLLPIVCGVVLLLKGVYNALAVGKWFMCPVMGVGKGYPLNILKYYSATLWLSVMSWLESVEKAVATRENGANS